MRLADQLRTHFGHRDHLYGVLNAELADDLEAGGPTAAILRDHLDAPVADVVQLRLLAGLFRLVLRGEAPSLAPWWLEDADPETAWPAVRDVLASHAADLRESLALAPQTNEPGRSAPLLIGLFEAVRRHGLSRVRLLEPGASAGLNLLVDRMRIVGPGWASGPADSPLVLDTGAAGVEPVAVEIVERRGCDLSPVDATTAAGAQWLTSFVWPFDHDRHDRLAAALEIVRAHPVTVDRAPAAQWVRERLADPVADDVLTVVWHSITAQYWPSSERAALRSAIADATVPVSRIYLEFPGSDSPAPVVSVDGNVIAHAHHHGLPVTLS